MSQLTKARQKQVLEIAVMGESRYQRAEIRRILYGCEANGGTVRTYIFSLNKAFTVLKKAVAAIDALEAQ